MNALVFIPHSGVANLPPPGALAIELRSAWMPRIAFIQALVADSYGIAREHMKSPCRHRSVALPRQVAMYLCRRELEVSFPLIAREFGGRDHATVFHAVKIVEKRMADDPDYAADIRALRKAVKA